MNAESRENDHIVESIHLNMLRYGSLEDQINQRDLKAIIGSPRGFYINSNMANVGKKKGDRRLVNVKQSRVISHNETN